MRDQSVAARRSATADRSSVSRIATTVPARKKRPSAKELSTNAGCVPLSEDERKEFQDEWLRAIERRRGDDAEQGVVDRELAERRTAGLIDEILRRKYEREFWDNRPTTDELLLEYLRCLEWHERPYEHRMQPMERLPLRKSKYEFWDDDEYTEWCEIIRLSRMAQGSAIQGATPSDIDEWLEAVWPGIPSDELTAAHDLAVNIPIPLARLDVSHPADLSRKHAHLFDVKVWRLTIDGRRYLEMRSGRSAAGFLQSTPEVSEQLAPTIQDSSEPATPALSNRKMYVLQAMFQANSLSADTRMVTDRIAREAEGPDADPNAFKESIAELARAGLIETKRGRGGGCWLTPQGKAVAEMLTKM